jgi:ketosteroid isomerase-like protein
VDEARNREVALRANELLGTPSVEEFLSLFAADPVWHLGRRELRGTDALAGLTAMSAKIFPHGVARDVRRVIAQGDCVVVQHVNRGETAQGTDYENEYAKIYVFDPGGLIREVWEFTDTAYSVKALNLGNGLLFG